MYFQFEVSSSLKQLIKTEDIFTNTVPFIIPRALLYLLSKTYHLWMVVLKIYIRILIPRTYKWEKKINQDYPGGP